MDIEMIKIRPMTIDDHDEIIQLFKETPGVTFRDADSRNATKYYLDRNPGLSFVAMNDLNLIGCVMCGHDGRRGYLQHLVVDQRYRSIGLGDKLTNSCILALEKIGILKTHLFVFRNNTLGNSFWANKGYKLRDDVNMYSFINSHNKNV